MSIFNLNEYTLSGQIRKKIGVRILISFALCLLLIACITVYDFYRGMQRLEVKVQRVAHNLDEYIISQVLMHNPQSINAKLEQASKQNNMAIKWEPNKEVKKSMQWVFPLSWIYKEPVKSLDGRKFGSIVFQSSFLKDEVFIYETLFRGLLLFAFLLALIVMLYPLSVKIPRQIFIEPLIEILSLLKNNDQSIRKQYVANNNELTNKVYEIREVEQEIINLLEKIERDSRDAALGQIAAQVAHDIRSPLAALNSLLDSTVMLSDEQRDLIRNTVKRINSIAFNLLQNNHQQFNSKSSSAKNFVGQETAIYPVYTLLNFIIAEKQIELKSQADIEFTVDQDAYLAFIKTDPTTFKRIISNVINNAAEAVEQDRTIQVELYQDMHYARVDIVDHGKGMPETVKNKVFEYGYSYSKTTGTGLGLAYCKQQLDYWGGTIDIVTQQAVGTRVSLTWPLSHNPEWCATSVTFMENSCFVLADDDPSAHSAWRQYLGSHIGWFDEQSMLVDFYDLASLTEWIEHYLPLQTKPVMFMIDYEFPDNDRNGLQFIIEHNLQKQAYLVTSKIEDPNIQKSLVEHGIKLLPKPLFPYVPCQICPQQPDLVLIDDNHHLGQLWQYQARRDGRSMAYFESAESFYAFMDYIDPETPVYVDQELGGEYSGIEVCRYLYQNGFEHLYLVTGHPKESMDKPEWIVDILGKNPV